MVSLGLSTKNNPKNHMEKIGKEDETKVEKEVFLLCNTKGLLTEGFLTVLYKE